jgi:threonyl-tRNA synthetase
MASVGKIEAEAGQVALRKHRAGDIGKYSLEEAIEMLKSEESQKKID